MLKSYFKIDFSTVAIGCLLLLAGCNSGSADTMPAMNDNSAPISKMMITKHDSTPIATITLNKGEKVTFINKDIVAHNATETKNSWASPMLANGQSWTFTPKKTSDYYCTVHMVMKGKIIVK